MDTPENDKPTIKTGPLLGKQETSEGEGTWKDGAIGGSVIVGGLILLLLITGQVNLYGLLVYSPIFGGISLGVVLFGILGGHLARKRGQTASRVLGGLFGFLSIFLVGYIVLNIFTPGG